MRLVLGVRLVPKRRGARALDNLAAGWVGLLRSEGFGWILFSMRSAARWDSGPYLFALESRSSWLGGGGRSLL